MNSNECYDLKHLASNLYINAKKHSEGKPVQWMKIKQWIKTRYFFKYNLKDTLKYIDMNKITKYSKTDGRNPPIKQLYERTLPISEAKKKDLVKLCTSVIAEELHGWFKSLNPDRNIIGRVPELDIYDENEPEEQWLFIKYVPTIFKFCDCLDNSVSFIKLKRVSGSIILVDKNVWQWTCSVVTI